LENGLEWDYPSGPLSYSVHAALTSAGFLTATLPARGLHSQLAAPSIRSQCILHIIVSAPVYPYVIVNDEDIVGGHLWCITGSTVTNSRFLSCSSASGIGGAIEFTGVGPLVVYNTTFFGCLAHNSGGAVYARSPVPINITYCYFYQCYTQGSGGALYLDSPLFLNVSYNMFLANWAKGGSGGAIYGRIGNIDVQYSLFHSCSATDSGGALYLARSGTNPTTLSINYANFSGCSAAPRSGSAVFLENFNASFDHANFIQCAQANASVIQIVAPYATVQVPLIGFDDNMINDPSAAFFFINVSRGSFLSSGGAGSIYMTMAPDLLAPAYFWELPLAAFTVQVFPLDDLANVYKVIWPYDTRPMGIELPRTPRITPEITTQTASIGMTEKAGEPVQKTGLKPGIIVVIVLVILVVLVLIGFVVLLMVRRGCTRSEGSPESVEKTSAGRRTLTYF
jgi:hypothetical protein